LKSPALKQFFVVRERIITDKDNEDSVDFT
jgi:hypothetical protein